MDFALSEEQKDIQNLAHQILGDMSQPESLKAMEQKGICFDRELWQALADAGLLGIAIDEDCGGMGFGFEHLCLLLEEAGRTVAKLPLLPVLVGAALPIQRFASEAQKKHLLPELANGKRLITSARIEPGRENPQAPATVATDSGDGLELTGCKHCVPAADVAGGVVLTAMHGSELIVALVDPAAEGITLMPQQVTSGETHYVLQLDKVAIAADQVLARGPLAEEWVQWTQQRYQAALCAMAVGVCDRMMRMTGSYTTEREQFGRAIATFQAVSHRMADCFIDVECLRLVTQQAVSLLDREREADEAVMVAKIWCGNVCHRVSQAAQHCHGGIGVDRDYPLFRYCLLAREIELTAGSSARLLGELGKNIAVAYG